MVYPDGEVLSYAYDSGGMLRQASGVKEGRGYSYVTRLEYDKLAQRAFLAAGNGTQTSYSYDPRDRQLTNLRAEPAGGTPFQHLLYQYDVPVPQHLSGDLPAGHRGDPRHGALRQAHGHLGVAASGPVRWVARRTHRTGVAGGSPTTHQRRHRLRRCLTDSTRSTGPS
jgi:hypothetical protein